MHLRVFRCDGNSARHHPHVYDVRFQSLARVEAIFDVLPHAAGARALSPKAVLQVCGRTEMASLNMSA